MNDKEKLLRDWGRMCREFGRCSNCPMDRMRETEESCDSCQLWAARHPEKAVKAIEKWAAEHPVKTRQVLFLEQFPNALLDNHGRLNINPCIIDVKLKESDMCNSQPMCFDCRIAYWKEEVENE